MYPYIILICFPVLTWPLLFKGTSLDFLLQPFRWEGKGGSVVPSGIESGYCNPESML